MLSVKIYIVKEIRCYSFSPLFLQSITFGPFSFNHIQSIVLSITFSPLFLQSITFSPLFLQSITFSPLFSQSITFSPLFLQSITFTKNAQSRIKNLHNQFYQLEGTLKDEQNFAKYLLSLPFPVTFLTHRHTVSTLLLYQPLHDTSLAYSTAWHDTHIHAPTGMCFQTYIYLLTQYSV
jgi:hypothetical protein